MSFVLAIDQGTTSSRAMVFRGDISIAAVAQQEFPQHFPASGWVEHEPDDIWTSTVMVCREALEKAGLKAKDIAAIGITNQRETTVVWDRATGQAVHRAIVWQDRRTADICARLKAEGHEPVISAKTGLIIDPYFSGTKVAGFSITCRVRASAPNAASCCSAPSIVTCYGGSPAAGCTRQTPPTPRARCCSTSTPACGMTTSSTSCACRARCSRR